MKITIGDKTVDVKTWKELWDVVLDMHLILENEMQ